MLVTLSGIFIVARLLHDWYMYMVGYQFYIAKTIEKWLGGWLLHSKEQRFNKINII